MIKSLILFLSAAAALKVPEQTEHPNIVKSASRSDLGGHPFENLPENVNMIQYTDEKAFTAKLT